HVIPVLVRCRTVGPCHIVAPDNVHTSRRGPSHPWSLTGSHSSRRAITVIFRSMTDRAFTTVLEGGSYFEGPRWHDGAWWASDFYRHTVSRVAPGGGETVVPESENQPSGL